MTEAVAHRGPDGSGVFSDAHAFLGHQRLSIVDLSMGSQPMSNEDESLWIVYNGEIFNHAAIRPEMERAGHRYKSHCDTETILHSFEADGPACVSRFRGMFSFAIWDSRARALFCARDRLTVPEIVKRLDAEVFAFASEIKALLKHPAISCRLDETVLPQHLAFGYVSDHRTLFAGIRKLMPGHFLRLDLNSPTPEPRVERYWDIPSPSVAEPRGDQDWINECRQRVEETVRMRLMSDVPLGVFLSGGVDSSAIAALASRMMPDRLNTFSVGYREEVYSELRYARRVAGHIGSNHHEVVVSREEFFDALPTLIWHEDAPITWPSSVSLYFVSRLAAQDVKVVLTGEGGYELFGGYYRYRTYLLNRRLAAVYRFASPEIRKFVRQRIASTSLLSASLRRKLGHTLFGRECDLESLYLENFTAAFSRQELAGLLHRPETASSSLSTYVNYWRDAKARTPLGQLLYADQKTYLVELLMKQDRMSMACSIESRVPFLDHLLVEFSARAPDHLKIHNGSSKYILKKSVENLLPRDIVHRRKMGFPTPLRKWLVDPAVRPLLERLTRRDSFLSQYLAPEVIGRLVAGHEAGFQDNTDRLWRLLNLELWAERVLGFETSETLVRP
jgi:asparagine synthase (glutamine-hydrolysing)